MEIISSGKHTCTDGSVVFTCSSCGCKFRMKPDEYHIEHSQWQACTSITYIYTNPYYSCYYANCPECHKMCCEKKDEITIPASTVTLNVSDRTLAMDSTTEAHSNA